MAHQLVEKRTMDAEEIRVFYDTYESSNDGGIGANVF
jgi:hypothetical protein